MIICYSSNGKLMHLPILPSLSTQNLCLCFHLHSSLCLRLLSLFSVLLAKDLPTPPLINLPPCLDSCTAKEFTTSPFSEDECLQSQSNIPQNVFCDIQALEYVNIGYIVKKHCPSYPLLRDSYVNDLVNDPKKFYNVV